MNELQRLSKQAIEVQDASNPLGVARSYAIMLNELRHALANEGLPNGTEAICNHPINKLWVYKIYDLARCGVVDLTSYQECYDACSSVHLHPLRQPQHPTGCPFSELSLAQGEVHETECKILDLPQRRLGQADSKAWTGDRDTQLLLD